MTAPFSVWTLLALMAAAGVIVASARREGDRVPHTARAAGARAVRRMAPPFAAFLVGGLAVGALTHIPALGLVAALASASLPISVGKLIARQRARELSAAWPDAIDQLIASIRSGDSLPAAVATLASAGPVPLRPSMTAVTAEYKATGDFTRSVERLRELLADGVTAHVVPALVLAHRVGGRELVRLLRALATFVREDQGVRDEISARQAWTVSGARAAAAAPWLILLLFSTRPEAISAFRSPAGNALVVAGAVTTFVGYRAMVALGRLPTGEVGS